MKIDRHLLDEPNDRLILGSNSALRGPVKKEDSAFVPARRKRELHPPAIGPLASKNNYPISGIGKS
jgi:hypothetical protein